MAKRKPRFKLFSKEEDEELAFLVYELGDKDFQAIAGRMEGRSPKQLKDRWFNYLSKSINEPWTEQEERLLLKNYAEHGPKLDLISKVFPSKSNIKAKLYKLLNQNKLLDETDPDYIDAPINSRLEFGLEEVLYKGKSEDICIEVPIQTGSESNSEPKMNYYPQQRNEQSIQPLTASPSANVLQYSCFQNGQVAMYQTSTGSKFPICIPSIIRKYHFTKQIGYGAFSSVTLATDIETNQEFAAKIIPMEPLNATLRQHILDEIEIMKKLDHPNIVKYIEHFETEDHRYTIIITERCVCALWQYIFSGMSFQEMKIIAYGIIQGLKYLHDNNITHSDIKMENVLLDQNKIPKICDFGYAKQFRDSTIDIQPPLTPTYKPPEAYIYQSIDLKKADIYALGILLYMISSKDRNYYAVRDEELIKKRAFEKLLINSNDGLQRLAARCASANPDDRPIADELLEDEFFDFN